MSTRTDTPPAIAGPPRAAVTTWQPFTPVRRRTVAWRERVATGGSAFAAAALLAYFALTPLAPFAKEPAASDTRRHLIVAGVLVLYLGLLLGARRLPSTSILVIPFVAMLIAAVLSIRHAIDPHTSLDIATTVIPAAPLVLVLGDSRIFSRRSLLYGLLLAGSLVALFALASVWDQWQQWRHFVSSVLGAIPSDMSFPPNVPRVHGVGSHPNVVGAVLALTIPAAVVAAGERGLTIKCFSACSLLAQTPALFFTLSRGAWVATAAGTVVAAAGLVFARGITWRRWSWWLLALAAAAGVLALAAAVALRGSARPDWLFRESLDPRADMRRIGLRIAGDSPVTGAGPGSFVPLYPLYDGRYPFAAVHAHNVPIQVAADYGMVGLATGALAVLTALAALAYRLWTGDPTQRRMAALAAGAGVAFLVHGLADSPHLFPEVLLTLGVAVTLGTRPCDKDANPWRNRPLPPPPGGFRPAVEGGRRFPFRRRSTWAGTGRHPLTVSLQVTSLVLLLGALVLLPYWWFADRATDAYEAATAEATAGRWDNAVALSGRAATRDADSALFQFQHGAALAARWRARGDGADLFAAIAAYERTVRLQPALGTAWADLALLYLGRGDRDSARDAAFRLHQVAGRDQMLQLAYASLTQQLDPPGVAVETLAGLLVVNPTLAQTAYFRQDAFRRERYPAIVNRAIERAEELTGPGPAAERLRDAIRIYAGLRSPDLGRMRLDAALAPQDTATTVALARLLVAARRFEEAEPLLLDAVERKGDSAEARAALGDFYSAIGEIDLARRQWVTAMWLDNAQAGNALGESFGKGLTPPAVIERQRALVEGASLGQFYLPFQTYRFSFHRHEPVPIIGPGDWLTAVPADYENWQKNLLRWQRERQDATGTGTLDERERRQ